MAELLRTSGKDIWLLGGGELVRSFLQEQLIDEIMVAVHPIVLGEGIPLFPPGSRRPGSISLK